MGTQNQKITGIDVSIYQGDINWEEVKTSGIEFAMAKATQSRTYMDPKFKENWDEIKRVGLIRTAYHFYVSNVEPIQQAENFCNAIGMLEANDLPAVLDLEDAGFIDGSDEDQYQKDVLIWLKIVEKKLGKNH